MTDAGRTSVPWDRLGTLVDGPLHPGGRDATMALLDRAGVGPDSRVLDLGAGAGEAVAMARKRGATAVGLDLSPAGDGVVRGEMARLPVRTGTVDAVLAECTLCLAADPDAVLSECRRVLRPTGRLAVADMTISEAAPPLPDRIETALGLAGRRAADPLATRLAAHGFDVRDRRDHQHDLLTMRDQVADRIDYGGLLRAVGEADLAAGIERLEAAVQAGTVGYESVIAVVADPPPAENG